MEAQPKCRSFKNISRNGLTSFNLLIYRDSVTLSAAAKRAPKVVPERHRFIQLFGAAYLVGKAQE